MAKDKKSYDFDKAKKLILEGKKLKEVSELLNIPYGYLAKISCEKKWSKKSKEIVKKIDKKTIEKTIEKISDKQSDRNARILNINDLALDAVEEYFKNKDYKKKLIKTKVPVINEEDGEPIIKNGEPLLKTAYEVVEVGIVDILDVNIGINVINKGNATVRINEGSDLPKTESKEDQESSQYTIKFIKKE